MGHEKTNKCSWIRPKKKPFLTWMSNSSLKGDLKRNHLWEMFDRFCNTSSVVHTAPCRIPIIIFTRRLLWPNTRKCWKVDSCCDENVDLWNLFTRRLWILFLALLKHHRITLKHLKPRGSSLNYTLHFTVWFTYWKTFRVPRFFTLIVTFSNLTLL